LQQENTDKSSCSTQAPLDFDTQVKVEESDGEDEDDDNGFDKDLSGAKREKSLGLLSTGFIRLFLSWKGTISLEQAGRKMSSEDIEDNKIKTKVNIKFPQIPNLILFFRSADFMISPTCSRL